MTKSVLISMVLASLLTACGGGGSSSSGGPIPNPGPSNNPPVSYTAQIRFVGVLAGHQIQAALRQVQAVSPQTAGTPIPIMIVSPIDQGCLPGDCTVQPFSPQGVVQAVVSPQPASTPAVSFTQTAAGVSIVPTASPAPSSTPNPLPTGVVGEAGVANNDTLNTQSAGTATATIGNPVNQQPSTQVYQYLAMAAVCNPPDSNSSPGWAWNGSAWVTVSDPAQADIYVTGATCNGLYASSGDSGTLHFPGGGMLFSTDNPFSGFTVAQLTSTSQTSASGSALTTANGDGSYNSILIAKTHDGKSVFKVFPTKSDGQNYIGAVEVSGAGVDGF